MIIVYVIVATLIVLGIFFCVFGIVRSFKKSKSLLHYQTMRDLITLKRFKKKGETLEISEEEINENNPIKHYEKMRDRMTLKNKVEVEEPKGFGLSISSIIGGFITILIGISLIGPITQQVNQTINQTQMQNNSINPATQWSMDILKSVPAFFAIVIALTILVTIKILSSNYSSI